MTAAQDRAERLGRRGQVIAWCGLLSMGSAEVTYNVYHAVHTGHLNPALACIEGLVPVLGAAIISELIAIFGGGWFLKTVSFGAMIAAMALSTHATADVIGTSAGTGFRWVFGAVAGTVMLVCLYVILNAEELAARKKALALGRNKAAGATDRGPSVAPPAVTTTAPAVAHGPAPAMAPPASAQVDQRGPRATGHGPSGGHDSQADSNREYVFEAVGTVGGYEVDKNGWGRMMPPTITGVGDSDGENSLAALSFADKSAEYEAARRRYRESVDAGKPLSDRALGKEFGYSRNWGKKRIEECEAEQAQIAQAL